MDFYQGITIPEKMAKLRSLQEKEGMAKMEDIKLLQDEINIIIEEEELKWKQLANEHWLKNGDKNSKYFHASVNQKRR
jgi:hypothetical protein